MRFRVAFDPFKWCWPWIANLWGHIRVGFEPQPENPAVWECIYDGPYLLRLEYFIKEFWDLGVFFYLYKKKLRILCNIWLLKMKNCTGAAVGVLVFQYAILLLNYDMQNHKTKPNFGIASGHVVHLTNLVKSFCESEWQHVGYLFLPKMSWNIQIYHRFFKRYLPANPVTSLLW